MTSVMIRWFGLTTALACMMLLSMGCSTSHQGNWEAVEGTGGDAAQAASLVAAGDAAFAQRDDEAQLLAAIDSWQQAVKINPRDADTWAKIARAIYFHGDCHVRFKNDDEALKARYQDAITAAERSLVAQSPSFGQKMRDGERIEEAIDVLSPAAVPALYWRSSALGRWASAEGFATLLSYKDEVRAIMQFCLDNDEAYFFEGPNRYFGVFFARAPGFAGGDLDKSREHFETSIARQPNYLGTRTLMAEDYAVKQGDRDLYEQLLTYVKNADPNSLPETAPENRCEQKKVPGLMEQIDDYF